MTAIRFFTDEDIHGAVAQALRRVGLDTVSTPEVQRIGSTDEDQLLWAALTQQRDADSMRDRLEFLSDW